MQNFEKDLGNALPSMGNAQPARLPDYFDQLKQTRCGTHSFLKQALQIWDIFDKWKISGKINAAIKCRQCGASRCAGCQQVRNGPSQRIATVGNVSVDYCCDKGLFFIIWALLCGLDRIITNQNFGAPHARQHDVYARGTSGIYGGAPYCGVDPMDMMEYYESIGIYGPGVGKSKGTGYGGGGVMAAHKTAAALENTPEDQKDMIIGDVLAVITPLLSSLRGSNAPLMWEAFQGSTVLDKVSELLRNDDMKNVTQRHHLYQRVLNFVHTLAKSPLYSNVMLRDRRVKEAEATLYSISQGKKAFKPRESSPPVIFYLKDLSTQAQVILKAAQVAPGEYKSKEGQLQVSLCKQIVDLQRTLPPGLSIGQARAQPSTNRAATYVPLAQYHKDHRSEEIADEVMNQIHCYWGKGMYWSGHVPGRMKKLVEQVANLMTSLPPGIFIRYASSRPDMIKALIIGPADTPYENGLFEFDILCPMNYPNGPPLVKLRTTGGGRVSFNPNLYADGKVCLSILGTFPGTPWMPNQSTLLQVLVSIQSMIFCEKPFFNEPGHEHRLNAEHLSRCYNAKFQASTIYHAMIEWINTMDRSIWKPIIEKHFVETAQKCMSVSSRWAEQATQLTRSRYGVQDDASWAGPHANPYTAADVSKAAQQLNSVLTQFLYKYGRR